MTMWAGVALWLLGVFAMVATFTAGLPLWVAGLGAVLFVAGLYLTRDKRRNR